MDHYLIDAVSDGTQHFYLYAKHWYQRTTIEQDLKTIMGRYSAASPEHIRTIDVMEVLLREVFKCLTLLGRNSNRFVDFVTRLRDIEAWKARSVEDRLDDVILSNCLIELELAQVRDGNRTLIHLGDPDPSILPLRDEAESAPTR
jgi:hypothetical protein